MTRNQRRRAVKRGRAVTMTINALNEANAYWSHAHSTANSVDGDLTATGERLDEADKMMSEAIDGFHAAKALVV